MKISKLKKFICVLLCFLSVIPWLTSVALADNSANQTVYVTISNESELRAFSNSCRLDSWSDNVVATLAADIYLTGDFVPAPVFSGVFDGQNHSIHNLKVKGAYSRSGLFGLLTETAQVRNLNVYGSVNPKGEVISAGGIAGENRGYMVSCVFIGDVNSDSISGGIAGINSGVINGCANFASVDMDINKIPKTSIKAIKQSGLKGIIELVTSGSMDSSSDRSGGIAGQNDGSILSCKNNGPVGSMKKSHNVGGIAGVSSGSILLCSNYGSIQGYSNVGGIVGQTYPYFKSSSTGDLLSGAVTEINNLTDIVDAFSVDVDTVAGNVSSSISGILKSIGDASVSAGNVANEASKFVNGKIAEVNQIVSLANGTLDGLNDLSAGLDSIGNEFVLALDSFVDAVENAKEYIKTQDKEIMDEGITNLLICLTALDTALDDINQMTTDLHTMLDNLSNTSFPQFSEMSPSLTGSITNLTYSIKNITASVDSLNKDINTTVNALTGTVRNITSEIKDVSDKIYSLAYSLSDLSLSTFINDISRENFSTSQNYNGIIQSCINTGSVEGVSNVGGITGAMSLTTSINVDSSENKSGISLKTVEYRSIVATSKNYGDVVANEKNCGGIAGNEGIGAITDCESYGYVMSDGINVGGIAGSAHGLVRNCFVRSKLTGKSYTGGIIGTGNSKTVIIDESSLINNFAEVEIYGCDQHNGGIAGSDTGAFLYNYYVSNTLNGFEGYSSEVKAAPITRNSLLGVQNCPEEFSWSESQLRAVQTCPISGTGTGLSLLQILLILLVILLTLALIAFIIYRFIKSWKKAKAEKAVDVSVKDEDNTLSVLESLSDESSSAEDVSAIEEKTTDSDKRTEEAVQLVKEESFSQNTDEDVKAADVLEDTSDGNTESASDTQETASLVDSEEVEQSFTNVTPPWKDPPEERRVSWKDESYYSNKKDSDIPKWKIEE